MTWIKIKNAKGYEYDDKVPNGYASWLDYWEKLKNQQAKYCKARYCLGVAEVGGHVKKIGNDTNIYILPIDKDHNNSDGIYEAQEIDLIKAP